MAEFVVYCAEYESYTDGIKYWFPTERREPIVRCRDCIYYDDYLGACCRGNTHQTIAATPDGFCAWGERRADPRQAHRDAQTLKRDHVYPNSFARISWTFARGERK